jgi:hypothetical protein
MNIRGIVIDPRTGFAKSLHRTTWYQEMTDAGLPVERNERSTQIDSITNMKDLLRKPGRFCIYLKKCGWSVEAFQNWAWDKIDKDTKDVATGSKPKHDKYSHNMWASLYLMDHYDNVIKESRKERRKSKKKIGAPNNWSFRA